MVATWRPVDCFQSRLRPHGRTMCLTIPDRQRLGLLRAQPLATAGEPLRLYLPLAGWGQPLRLHQRMTGDPRPCRLPRPPLLTHGGTTRRRRSRGSDATWAMRPLLARPALQRLVLLLLGRPVCETMRMKEGGRHRVGIEG